MSMKASLERIYRDKRSKRKELRRAAKESIAAIYGLVWTAKDAKRLAVDLLKKTINFKKLPPESRRSLLAVGRKAAKRKKDGSFPAWILSQMNAAALKVDSDIERRGIEAESAQKPKAIEEGLSEAREGGRVYWLASSHDDCAEDHVPYQGRIYIDGHWASSVKDPAMRQAIKAFNAANKVKTVQWSMGSPAYFITRPNCRHYFESISTADAMGMSPSALAAKYRTHREVGERNEVQTPTAKQADIQRLIDFYERRLSMHLAMQREHPTDELRRAIEKDRMLIAKWKNVLNKRKKG